MVHLEVWKLRCWAWKFVRREYGRSCWRLGPHQGRLLAQPGWCVAPGSLGCSREGHTFNFMVLRAEHHRFTYDENSRTGENQELFTYIYIYIYFYLLQHSTFMCLAEPQTGLWHERCFCTPAWHLFTSPWHPRPNVSDTPGTRDPADHPDRNGWSPSTSAWNRPRWGVLENIHAAFPALWKFRSKLGFHVL